MSNWKVEMTVGNDREKKTIFLKNIETKEIAYSTAKIWFMSNYPDVDFWGVDTAIQI